MKLHEKIMYCRKKLGLSQEELALKIGVSRQSVSKWETGETSPEISKLPLLAECFNVTTDWLLSEEDEIPTEEHEPVAINSVPSWLEKLPSHMVSMIKRFGWIYGLGLMGNGALVIAFGLLGRTLFKTMIFDTPQYIDGIYFAPDAFELQGWKIASTFTGFIIGLGLIILITGAILAIVLKKWGNKNTQ